MSCVREFVWVIQQESCLGCNFSEPITENTGTGSRSPGCSFMTEKSIVRPSIRGGVPVFKRPCGNFSSFKRAERETAGGSLALPAE